MPVGTNTLAAILAAVLELLDELAIAHARSGWSRW
jgi:hypothetical protein